MEWDSRFQEQEPFSPDDPELRLSSWLVKAPKKVCVLGAGTNPLSWNWHFDPYAYVWPPTENLNKEQATYQPDWRVHPFLRTSSWPFEWNKFSEIYGPGTGSAFPGAILPSVLEVVDFPGPFVGKENKAEGTIEILSWEVTFCFSTWYPFLLDSLPSFGE